MRRLYILAGANGSEKSTISKVLLPAEHLVYVNPDDIAKELRPDYTTTIAYVFEERISCWLRTGMALSMWWRKSGTKRLWRTYAGNS